MYLNSLPSQRVATIYARNLPLLVYSGANALIKMILLLLYTTLVLGEIELQSKISTNGTFEEDENFQEEQNYYNFQNCNETALKEVADQYCSDPFHETMTDMGNESWCDWKWVIRPYHDMTLCLETVTNYLGCSFPNHGIKDIYLKAHSLYFQDCFTEEQLSLDAPAEVVVTLTLIPIGLMVILVFIVVWKT